jgi:hypothetical protein
MSSSSATYTTFAVAGAGLLGQKFVDALVSTKGVSVRALTRPGSGKSFSAGVGVKEVNYEDEVCANFFRGGRAIPR